MTATKYNARDCRFEIEDPAHADTWVPIAQLGINTFTKSRNSQSAETTTFGSDGDYEQQINQRGKTLGLQGFRLKDPDTGALDPGQALVETLAEGKGDGSLGVIRFAHKDDPTWQVWTCTAELGDEGGDNNGKVSWAVTFTRSGADTTMGRT